MLKRLPFNEEILYIIGLIIIAVSIPFSKFTMSVGIIWIGTYWVLERGFQDKWQRLKKNKAFWAFISFYLFLALSLLWSEDIQYGLQDLNKKLPLLIFPIIFASRKKLSEIQLNLILAFFLLAVFVASIISTGIWFSWCDISAHDRREISPFISHIRLALSVAFGVFVGIFLFFRFPYGKKKPKSIFLAVSIWLIVFLFILKSLTGIFVFASVSMIISLKHLTRIQNFFLRYFLLTLLSVILMLSGGIVTNYIKEFYRIHPVDKENLDQKTLHGRKYLHDFKSNYIENGHYWYSYYCEEELAKEWNKRSDITFDDTDKRGNQIRYTLIRYLTSKGLRKDSVGVWRLSMQEVNYIENGIPNYKLVDGNILDKLLYPMVWQYDQLKKGNKVEGLSIAQRLLYWDIAKDYFFDNAVIGIGVGDVKKSFEEAYSKKDIKLSNKWQRRTHNQFLTLLMSIGILGFIVFIFAFTYPAYKQKLFKDYLFLCILSISMLSFLNEDTLENHTGTVFVSFFICLFMFAKRSNIDSD